MRSPQPRADQNLHGGGRERLPRHVGGRSPEPGARSPAGPAWPPRGADPASLRGTPVPGEPFPAEPGRAAGAATRRFPPARLEGRHGQGGESADDPEESLEENRVRGLPAELGRALALWEALVTAGWGRGGGRERDPGRRAPLAPPCARGLSQAAGPGP